VRPDATCPTCGHEVEPGGARTTSPPDAPPDELPPLPWHFKALAGALALYLGYRAFQGIEWLVGRL